MPFKMRLGTRRVHWYKVEVVKAFPIGPRNKAYFDMNMPYTPTNNRTECSRTLSREFVPRLQFLYFPNTQVLVMDPLSIAVASVSLVTGVTTLIKNISQFVVSVRDAHKDLDLVSRELQSLNIALGFLAPDTTSATGLVVPPQLQTMFLHSHLSQEILG